MTSPEMLKNALEFRKTGWSVVPLKERGKSPKLDSWKEFQKQPATEDQIREWWEKWPQTNVGVVTGAVSGLVVVDVDSEEAMKSLQPYLNEETLRCKTGKGWHFYFKHPGGHVPNPVGVLEGVDVRADGGLVVAPPSTPSGRWISSSLQPDAQALLFFLQKF